MAKPNKIQEQQIFELFVSFYEKSIEQKTFIRCLRELEKKYYNSKNQEGIWFRLFKGDTGATTVNDIERDLNTEPNCYQNNRRFCLERIETGVTDPSLKLEIKYS